MGVREFSPSRRYTSTLEQQADILILCTHPLTLLSSEILILCSQRMLLTCFSINFEGQFPEALKKLLYRSFIIPSKIQSAIGEGQAWAIRSEWEKRRDMCNTFNNKDFNSEIEHHWGWKDIIYLMLP
uniref:Uncharacterized protein n=1 Tax=Pipistrellus kuhlii TaxID=59472 RepID=A0A7J8B232_PIPKU|nr:hypothetical protein mPipKuh1_007890 [Pipistrellus kuhlii]